MKTTPTQSWFDSLVLEMHQVELSAREHPAMEAERLGEHPPAFAMRAIAEHAEEIHTTFHEACKELDLEAQEDNINAKAGFFLSLMRRNAIDVIVCQERSYRNTLLTLQHGLDLAQVLQQAAREHEHTALFNWTNNYIQKRSTLLSDARLQLMWFASNPEIASEPTDNSFMHHAVHVLLSGAERVSQAVTNTVQSITNFTADDTPEQTPPASLPKPS